MKFSLFSMMLVVTFTALVLQLTRLDKEHTELTGKAEFLLTKLAEERPVKVNPQDIAELKLLQLQYQLFESTYTELIRVFSGPPYRDIRDVDLFSTDDSTVVVGEIKVTRKNIPGHDYSMYKINIPVRRQLAMAIEFLDPVDGKRTAKIELENGTHLIFIYGSWERNLETLDGVRGVFRISINGEPYRSFNTGYESYENVSNLFRDEKDKRDKALFAAKAPPTDQEDFQYKLFTNVHSYSNNALPTLSELVMFNESAEETNAMSIRVRLVDLEVE